MARPPFKLVFQPMNQAEVLHTPSYDLSMSCKNTTEGNELVLPSENPTFLSKKYIYVAPHLPLNMPAATKNITLQEDKPSLRVTWGIPRSADFAWAKRFCVVGAPKSSADVTFQRICHFRFSTSTMQTLTSFRIFSPPMDRAEVLHVPKYCPCERIGKYSQRLAKLCNCSKIKLFDICVYT